MKKGFLGKLIRGMLVSLVLAGLFGVVLVCGMKCVRGRFSLREYNTVQAGNLLHQVNTEGVKPMPDIAVQTVFVEGEDGTLCSCFYTMLDCIEERLDFYMVPTDTRLQLSAELYQELVTKNTKLAQVNTLEGLYRCFDEADAAGCAVKALEEAVGVTADYVTVMPQSCYEGLIKEEAHTYAYDGFLREELQENIIASGSMKAYLTNIWEQCESSVSPECKLYYLETYEGLTNLSVSCRMIAGERHNSGYVLKGSGLR